MDASIMSSHRAILISRRGRVYFTREEVGAVADLQEASKKDFQRWRGRAHRSDEHLKACADPQWIYMPRYIVGPIEDLINIEDPDHLVRSSLA